MMNFHSRRAHAMLKAVDAGIMSGSWVVQADLDPTNEIIALRKAVCAASLARPGRQASAAESDVIAKAKALANRIVDAIDSQHFPRWEIEDRGIDVSMAYEFLTLGEPIALAA